MMIRVYALWRRDKRVLTLMVVLWLTQVGFGGMALGFSQRAYPLSRHPSVRNLMHHTHALLRIFILADRCTSTT
jgi:hypothetical protein